jgi:hypothetical protein
MMIHVVDSGARWLHRVGGISALTVGVAYIAIIALYVHIGPPPSSVAGYQRVMQLALRLATKKSPRLMWPSRKPVTLYRVAHVFIGF